MIIFILVMLCLLILWLYCAFIINSKTSRAEERDDNDGKTL